MPDPNQQNEPQRDDYWQAEVDLGGADNVQKTTYVRGAGTEPDASSNGPIATMPSSAGPSPLIAVLVAISIVAAIVYVVALAG